MKGKMASVKLERTKLVVTDWITANLSFMLFNVLRFTEQYPYKFNFDAFLGFITQTKVCFEQLIIPVILLGVYWISGFYNNPFGKSRFSEFMRAAIVAFISTILIHLLLMTNDQMDDIIENLKQFFLIFAIFFSLTLSGRLILINSQIHHFKRRLWQYTSVIVGNSSKAHELARKLKESKSVISYGVEGFFEIPGEENIGQGAWNLKDIEDICRERNIDQIILAPENNGEEKVFGLLYKLFPLGKPIRLTPDTINFMTQSIKLNDIYGYPLVDLTHSSMGECEKNIKRTFDVIASFATLIVLSPIYLILALWVKLDSKGSVFYRQERIGRHEKPFKIIKFRTMFPDAEISGPQLSEDHDPRVTRAGRIMRKYRLDELPQFWNVLKGDMSIVGPRPEREHYIRQIMEKAPFYALLYQTRPGITSWGMVQFGYASRIDEMIERSKYDLLYMSNMSILVDLKIMLYTILTILEGRGK